MADVAKNEVGARIREARERLNMKQKKLAKLAGFSHHQQISAIEQGQRDIRANELMRLASALHVEMGVLLGTQPFPDTHLVQWRERPEEGADESEARLVQRAKRFHHLLEMTEARPQTLPQFEIQDRASAEAEAQRAVDSLIKQLDLGSRPAASLQKILESEFHVLIWFEDLGSDGSAACTHSEHGNAILVNSSEVPWRRNFDIAHELFHLVTWNSLGPGNPRSDDWNQEEIERLANTFAATLLLPAEEVRAELYARADEGKIDGTDLIGIAVDFGVSTEALLWRLKTLGFLKYAQAKELLDDQGFRQTDRGQRRGRRHSPKRQLPSTFVWLAFLACMKGALSRSRMAEYLETSLVELPLLLEEHDISEKEERDYQETVVAF